MSSSTQCGFFYLQGFINILGIFWKYCDYFIYLQFLQFSCSIDSQISRKEIENWPKILLICHKGLPSTHFNLLDSFLSTHNPARAFVLMWNPIPYIFCSWGQPYYLTAKTRLFSWYLYDHLVLSMLAESLFYAMCISLYLLWKVGTLYEKWVVPPWEL